jgi:hypothetical protein
MRSLDDLFLVWLLASMIAALLPIPRAPMMLAFGMLVFVIANAMLGIP